VGLQDSDDERRGASLEDLLLKGEIHLHLHIDEPITINLNVAAPQGQELHITLVPGTPVHN